MQPAPLHRGAVVPALKRRTQAEITAKEVAEEEAEGKAVRRLADGRHVASATNHNLGGGGGAGAAAGGGRGGDRRNISKEKRDCQFGTHFAAVARLHIRRTFRRSLCTKNRKKEGWEPRGGRGKRRASGGCRAERQAEDAERSGADGWPFMYHQQTMYTSKEDLHGLRQTKTAAAGNVAGVYGKRHVVYASVKNEDGGGYVVLLRLLETLRRLPRQ
jgi:hypothetical protein